MRLRKYQKGFSVWSLSFTMLLIGFTVYTVLKVFPVYMDDFNISGAMESMESEPEDYRGALSVQQAMMRRLAVNNVKRLKREDVSVTRDGQMYNIEIAYEVVVPYIGNISLLLNFNHTASVRARV